MKRMMKAVMKRIPDGNDAMRNHQSKIVNYKSKIILTFNNK